MIGASSEEVDRFGSEGANHKDMTIGFDLERQAAERLRPNEVNIKDREERLKQSGEFDAPDPVLNPKRSKFKRGDEVRLKTGLKVQHVEGNRVLDTEGTFRQVRGVVITQGNAEIAEAER